MPIYESITPGYRDRQDAGKVLASRLLDYKGQNVVVLAIPNGGVPVGRVIAEELDAELYLMIVRKLQIPHNPEAGFGAVTPDGFVLLNHSLVDSLGITEKEILKQLKLVATKTNVDEIKQLISIYDPIKSKFVTKEEMEKFVGDKISGV